MKTDYSKKELEMIRFISPFWADTIEKGMDSSIIAPTLFDTLGLLCFVENKTGKAVDSLRRCIQALKKGTCLRLTKEFDALIELPTWATICKYMKHAEHEWCRATSVEFFDEQDRIEYFKQNPDEIFIAYHDDENEAKLAASMYEDSVNDCIAYFDSRK